MQKIRKITALLLAVLTLASSSTFSLDLHFCGGTLESVSLITDSEPCAMQKGIPPCHKKMAASCCENHSYLHDGDEFSYQLSLSDIQHNAESFTPSLTELYTLVSESDLSTPETFIDSGPPLKSFDRNIRFRTFLI
jgi:hypothetical protein